MIPAPSPPDRTAKTPLPGFGADTVRLRGPATWDLFDQMPDKRFQQMVDDDTGELYDVQRGGRTAVAAGRTLMAVTVDLRSGSPSINMEFSASALVDGHNAHPLPFSALTEVSHVAWQEARRELTGVPAFKQMHLTRLDVARTFTDVKDIPATLLALSRHRASRVRVDTLERGRNTRWQSLTRGNTGTWRAVLYGKAEELRDRASRTYDPEHRALLRHVATEVEDHLRYELQLRDLLREANLTDHTSIDEGALRHLAAHHFQRTRFGDVVDSGPERARDLIGGLPRREQRGVLAVLGADLLKMPVPLSHNPEDDYRAVLGRLQLTPEDRLPRAGAPRRLDFEAGAEAPVPEGTQPT